MQLDGRHFQAMMHTRLYSNRRVTQRKDEVYDLSGELTSTCVYCIRICSRVHFISSPKCSCVCVLAERVALLAVFSRLERAPACTRVAKQVERASARARA